MWWHKPLVSTSTQEAGFQANLAYVESSRLAKHTARLCLKKKINEKGKWTVLTSCTLWVSSPQYHQTEGKWRVGGGVFVLKKAG